MEITYELTQKDFTESFLAHRNRRTWVKWTRRIAVWLVLVTSALLLFGSIRTGNTKTLAPLFGLVALWLAIIAGLPSWWSARRQFLKQPGAHGPRTVLLDTSGAHWRWNGGSSDIEWKNYIRSVEGKNQILFYTSPACFNILPKRAIAAEQLSEIRSLLDQNIQSRK
jgi:YcxB-like protein